MYRKYFKRPLDIILSLLGLIILSPVLIVVAILVRINLGSPVLFTQNRPGLNEKIFKMYKFRSMTDKKDDKGELLPDSIRLTKFGRVLRSTSLDELPELWNILKGDMSIVGPRPLAVSYLPYYTKLERKRHSVRPGLTGLAQINGRNTSDWEERFKFDLMYIDSMTFQRDVNIMFKTIKKIFSKSDIGERGVDAPIDFHLLRGKSNEGDKI